MWHDYVGYKPYVVDGENGSDPKDRCYVRLYNRL